MDTTRAGLLTRGGMGAIALGLVCCARSAERPGYPGAPAAASKPSTVGVLSTDKRPSPPPGPVGAPPSVDVRFSSVGVDRWRAEYTFSAPVHAVAFSHPAVPRGAWRVVEPPDAAIVGAFVVAHKPFGRLVLELPTDTSDVEREYTPFHRYTDGAVLVYTGQLGLAGATCSATPCNDAKGLSASAPLTGTVTLEASPERVNERVVVAGRSPAREARIDSTERGSFAYFGDLPPIETASFIGVVDEGLPDWMRARVVSDLPKLFALYAERLGPLSGDKATLFMTFAKRASGMSMGGSVIPPGTMSLDFQLAAARLTDKAAMRTDVDWFAAHEGLHFWNGGEHTPPDDESSIWLNEGTADALALRALRAIGVFDQAEYRRRSSLAASACALWLSSGIPLGSSARPGNSSAFYACGATMNLIVEAACKRRDPKADLFTFWRRVFDDAKPTYDEALFDAVLSKMGGDPALAAAIGRIVHDKLADPARALRETLSRVGLETATLAGALPAPYEQIASIPEVEALLPTACSDALVYDGNQAVRPIVNADGACPGLAKGETIEQIAGIPVAERGASSFRAAYAQCLAKGAVDVTTAKKAHVVLPCARHPGRPPGYFVFRTLP